MIEKINPELLETSRRYYEKELSRPKFNFYEKVRRIDGRVSSVVSAIFCDSFENFLATYKAVYETFENSGYLDGKTDERRAFLNIFSLYAAASETLHHFKKFPKNNNSATSSGKYHINLDFSQGSYTLIDELVGQFLTFMNPASDTSQLLALEENYFTSILDVTKQISRSSRYESFIKQISDLHLQINGITLNGFSYTSSAPKIYSFKANLEDIVGNKDMISVLKKAVRNLLKYDPESKSNVMYTEFDGFQRTFTFYGPPGSGKSITIEALLHEATEFAEKIGRPLEIENVTNAFKSEYYSKSTQNLKEIFDRVREGDTACILILDDIDTILFSRNELDNRPEDKAILGTVMNYLEGIEAPKFGNDLVIATTNRPEILDNALFSRLSESVIYVPGPQIVDEYVQLFKIKLRKSIQNGLVK
ncbi:MAG: AAA family ATPase, partial [Nanoarchaeota archaeon]